MKALGNDCLGDGSTLVGLVGQFMLRIILLDWRIARSFNQLVQRLEILFDECWLVAETGQNALSFPGQDLGDLEQGMA